MARYPNNGGLLLSREPTGVFQELSYPLCSFHAIHDRHVKVCEDYRVFETQVELLLHLVYGLLTVYAKVALKFYVYTKSE